MTTIELGVMAKPLTEQFPALADVEHLQKDNEAISRLRIRGLLTHAESDRSRRRLAKQIQRGLEKIEASGTPGCEVVL